MLKRFESVAGKKAFVIAASAASLFSIGYGIDHFALPDGLHKPTDAYTGYSADNLKEAKAVARRTSVKLEEATAQRNRFEQRIGSTCFQKVQVYLDPRVEDSIAVRELLEEPGAPCGASPTEIRTDIGNAEYYNGELSTVKLQNDGANKGVSDFEAYEIGDDNFSGAIAFGALGVLIGVAIPHKHPSVQSPAPEIVSA